MVAFLSLLSGRTLAPAACEILASIPGLPIPCPRTLEDCWAVAAWVVGCAELRCGVPVLARLALQPDAGQAHPDPGVAFQPAPDIGVAEVGVADVVPADVVRADVVAA